MGHSFWVCKIRPDRCFAGPERGTFPVPYVPNCQARYGPPHAVVCGVLGTARHKRQSLPPATEQETTQLMGWSAADLQKV